LALLHTKGCAKALAEWNERGDLYTTIEPTDATNTPGKRSGLIRQQKIWGSSDLKKGLVTLKKYKSAANRKNHFCGGMFIAAEAEPNDGTAGQHEGQQPTLPIYFVSKSTVDEILLDGRCRDLKGLRQHLRKLLRPSARKAAVAKSKRKRNENISDADKERRDESVKQAVKRYKKRETIKKLVDLPDIKTPLTTMTSAAVMRALVNMKYCIWDTTQRTLFFGEVVLLCEPEHVHDVKAYVRSLHYALVDGTLVALDTEFTPKKGVKQADTPATSMGMSTGGTSDEYTKAFMSDLSETDATSIAENLDKVDLVSQWASSDTLDTQKLASALALGGRAAALHGVKNLNIFRVVYNLMGGWKGIKRDGSSYSMKLGAVFMKVAPERLHKALCYWHIASYDAFMLHCIAVFVVNSLVRTLALTDDKDQPLPDVEMPESIPDPNVHAR
jgi:hypothetical protein